MKISSKGRYAVRVMAELARHENETLSVTYLSANQGITIKYLEKILALLTKAKLVESSRGAQGGYKLTKSPEKYSVADILKVTDDLPELAPCLCSDSRCPRADNCDSLVCWDKLSMLITDYLNSVSLKDLLNKSF